MSPLSIIALHESPPFDFFGCPPRLLLLIWLWLFFNLYGFASN